MPDSHQLLIFIVAGWLLNLTPGPDVLYIVTNALRRGARAGVVASFGITAGCFVHIFAAAIGVSALMAASSTAFTVLKLIGAAYLVYVGVRMLMSKAPALSLDGGAQSPDHARPSSPTSESGLSDVFVKGFLTNVLNPKVALFFLAFVPQFIAPGVENKAWVFFLLGLLFNINAIPVNIGWALGAAWLARRVGAVQRGMHWLERVAGALFIGFGLKLAFSENPMAALPSPSK
ncbi:LysE family translocator [Variovorax sp. VNK109]|jgi:threonine/homoserine/homoserine lactone efflux protein|uniref:LysE family translocator n=1 Tax=Variovorax sp. VNK109 TaxID=3400919 RepID=UPI003C0A8F01